MVDVTNVIKVRFSMRFTSMPKGNFKQGWQKYED